MQAEIVVKRLVTIDEAMGYVAKIQDFLNAEKLVFVFSPLEYVKMISVCLFARELRQAVKYRKQLGLPTYSRGHDDSKSVPLSYLSFIGFFDFIGLDGIGMKVRHEAEVTCRNPYLAITRYDYRRFKVWAEYDSFRSEYDFISEEASKISLLLTKNACSQNQIVSYALREIMRNAYEHSGSVDFYVMGQTWSNGSAELVIMDDGCGILKSLAKKYPTLATEKAAIIEAMKPGVSGSDFGHNRYNNSGFGLYVLSEFSSQHGHMCIASGKTLLTRDKSGVNTSSVWDDGTLVGIHLDEIPDNAQEEMEHIIRKGDIISQQGEYPIRPSKETWNI